MIPQIIHFTVPAQISEEQQRLIALARDIHPEWKVMIWQDPVDPSDFRLSGYWNRANSGAQLADLIRLDVIYKYGGVYLDSDMEILKPLGQITNNCDAFFCSEDGHVLTNAAFGASAEHPAIGALIDHLLKDEPDWSLLPDVTTGPKFFARVLKWRTDLTILPREAFYPYNWNEMSRADHPAGFGRHHWAASWIDKSPPKKRSGFSLDVIGRLREWKRSSERGTRWFSRRIDGYSAAGQVVRRTAHGPSIVLSGSDISITPEVFMNGYYELREELFTRRVLRGGDFFIDVGANVGVYSLLAASRVGPFGRVFAYEPNPGVVELLGKSAIMNWTHDRIVIRSKAVGVARKTATLKVVSSSLGGSAIADACTSGGAFERTMALSADVQEVQVEVVSLDDEFPIDVPIRILKIDAEGFESEVLAGAERLLSAGCIDFVFVEAVAEVAGSGWLSLIGSLERLRELGYEPFSFSRDGAIESTTLTEVRTTGVRGGRNVVMKRRGVEA